MFDRLFIYGPVGIALALGAVAAQSPTMFTAVVLLDIWLFANPHLMATFSRIGFDWASVKKHWSLLCVLPLLALVGVSLVALAYEVSGLFTLYFVAQTYHVTRQSFGVSRAYLRAAGYGAGHDYLSEGLIHLVPLWGLLHRCAQAPTQFYGYPISLPEVSPALADGVGVAACAWLLLWAFSRRRQASAGSLNWGHCQFVASHVLITGIAYVASPDITVGWLVYNLWHNLQYLQFVWLQNLRTHAQLPSRQGRRLSAVAWLSQSRNTAACFALCLVLGAAFYQGLTLLGEQMAWLSLPTVLILHFTFNYHHYLVDGVIWKRQK